MTAEHFEALSLSEYYLKTVWLMRFADLIAIDSEKRTNYLNTLHWHKCIVLMLQQVLMCNNQSSLKGSLVCYPHRIFHYP